MLKNNVIKLFSCFLFIGFFLSDLKVSGQEYPDFRRSCVSKNNNDIILYWSPLTNPCDSFVKLFIFTRNNSTNPYTLLDSIDQISATNYTHVNAATVSNAWEYYLRYDFLCNGDSSFSISLLLDIDQPAQNPIDSVSVDPITNTVIIGWSPSAAIDIMEYVTWRTSGTNNIAFDKTPNTFYADINTNSSDGSTGYKITAVDSCSNQSVISDEHRTIFLTHTIDTCNNKITLSWSPYKGWGSDGHHVYRRNAPGDYELLSTLPANIYTYIYQGNYNDTLDFYVRAFNNTNGFTSRSNKASLRIPLLKGPKYNYLSKVSVEGEQMSIEGTIDNIGNTRTFYLLRSIDNIHYDTIVKKDYDNKNDWSLFDKNISVSKQYYYKTQLTDLCYRAQKESNTSKNIVLHISEGAEEDTIKINWNNYASWDGEVEKYTIYRSENTGDGFTWNFLSSVNYPDSIFNDINVLNEIETGSACYYIVANEKQINAYNKQETSSSNIVCFSEPLRVYFPNALVSTGFNNKFIPKGTSINLKQSKIEIYSRMGQMIYKSDLTTYWDGKDKSGTMLPSGVYMYIATIVSFENKIEFHKGNITLIH